MDTTAVTQELPHISTPPSTLPWAGIITGSAHGEPMTSQELLAISGLDWDVSTRPLYRKLTNGTYAEHPRAKEVYRTDTEASLGVVRGKYHAWPNREAFRFADTFAETGQGTWCEAGTQRNGARVFMTMKLTSQITIVSESYDVYLFVGAGHDGYVAVNPSIVPVHSSTQSSHAIGRNSLRIQHTPSLESHSSEAAMVSELRKDYLDKFTAAVSKLINTKVADSRAQRLVQNSLNPRRAHRSDTTDAVMSLYTAGDHHGTAYGAFTALAQWQSQVRKHRAGNARFDSLMWGEDAKSRNYLASAICQLP